MQPQFRMAELVRTIKNISYNRNELELVDACSLTANADVPIAPFGRISGTDITVMDYIPGLLKLRIDKEIPQGKTWSGTLNIIKFRSIIDEQSVVTYSLQ